MPDYSIQPIRFRPGDGTAGPANQAALRPGAEGALPLAWGDSIRTPSIANGATQAPDSSQNSAATGDTVSIGATQANEKTFIQLAGLVTSLQGEGQIDADRLTRLMAKLTQSIEGGAVVLTPEEQAALKALVEQASPSELARRFLAATGQAVSSNSAQTATPVDVNGVRLDGKALLSLQQIFQSGTPTQASGPGLPASAGVTADLILNGLAAGLTPSGAESALTPGASLQDGLAASIGKAIAASSEGAAMIGESGAQELARSLAGMFSGAAAAREALMRSVIDMTFIRTTRQVATLLLIDPTVSGPNTRTSSPATIASSALTPVDSTPPLNSLRLESLMQTLGGVAPFLENGQSGPTLSRLGQWIGAIAQTVAELDAPGNAPSGSSNAMLQSPGMRNLIARGFSFDLVFEPSVKVDSAIATLKANGFETLRITDTATATNHLRITVPGRDSQSPGPIHLDLHTAPTADARENTNSRAVQGSHAPAAQVSANANVDTANQAPAARESVALPLATHLAAEAASSGNSGDPIRQMGIPAHMFSHQLDPLLMGWTAFYETQRPVNNTPADPVQTFRRATRPPLMIEYKPVTVISPGASAAHAPAGDILDVEDFTAS